MMNPKKVFIIVSAIVMIILLLSISFHKPILYYETYTLHSIDVSSESILIEGVIFSSGNSVDGFDYSIENDTVYLTIYQQSIFSSEALNGKINIKLDGDFSNIIAIYLNQAKGEPIKVWPLNE